MIAGSIDRGLPVNGIRAVIPTLSPRQRTIVGLIAQGLADKQIARALGVSRRTVRTQLERVYRRHGIHSKPEAVALLLPLPLRPAGPPDDGQLGAAPDQP